MPKLNRVTFGSTVNIPLNGGGRAAFVAIGANHYRKSEVCLLSQEAVYLTDPFLYVSFCRYRDSMLDSFLSGAYLERFPRSIVASLTPVPIPALYAEWDASGETYAKKKETIYRKCFVLSATEYGLTPYSYAGGALGTAFAFTSNNQKFPDFKTVFTQMNHTAGYQSTYYATLRDTYSVREGYIWAHKNGLCSANIRSDTAAENIETVGAGSLFPVWLPGIAPAPSGSTDVNQSVVQPRVCYPVLSMNGNVEVTDVNGGDILQTTGVESYRKIDGVWYRTD